MARSFLSAMNQMARAAARASREAEAARRRHEQSVLRAHRESERQARTLERNAIRAAKLARQEYLLEREREVADMNSQLATQVAELERILEATLVIDDAIDFETLRTRDEFPPFQPPTELTKVTPSPSLENFTETVPELGFLGRFFPSARKKRSDALAAANAKFETAKSEHAQREQERVLALAAAAGRHEIERRHHQEEVARRNAEVETFRNAYLARDPEAVSAYASMVLERSDYPPDFPHEFRLAFVPASSEVVIEYQLPGPELVPKTGEFRFVKSKDEIEEKPRKATEVNSLYQEIVAAIALRTIHEVFESDQANAVAIVTFNGFVQGTDPATGKDIRPHLISVRATKEQFLNLNLARIDKKVCLRNLGANVSPRASEIQPVRPIVEFSMVDPRFVAESDILGDLDGRPNLFDLDPFEFENLVANLFSQMGLEARLTRSSRDGGVDVVAYDSRPVLGGKVVIQAKRWKNTVGVSAARDLYGTMQHEGANKGILVTTSGCGTDAFEFSKDKPIELIDGGRLLYLLEQVGVRARIVFPDELG